MMKLKGKEYPTSTGMNVWINYCKLKNTTITALGGVLEALEGGGTGEEIRDLLFCSIQAGCKRDGVVFTMTPELLGEEIGLDDYQQVVEFIQQLMGTTESHLEPSGNGASKKKKPSPSKV